MPDEKNKWIKEEKLLEHLGNEITNHTAYLLMFRSRIAFTILIGPFLVMGSFLIATKGVIEVNELNRISIVVAGAIACLCYLGLGWYGSLLDKHVTTKCNDWRRLIYKLQKGSPIEEKDLVFEHKKQTLAYLTGLVLVLGAFIATTLVFFSLLAKG